jgi:hypothetical protein
MGDLDTAAAAMMRYMLAALPPELAGKRAPARRQCSEQQPLSARPAESPGTCVYAAEEHEKQMSRVADDSGPSHGVQATPEEVAELQQRVAEAYERLAALMSAKDHARRHDMPRSEQQLRGASIPGVPGEKDRKEGQGMGCRLAPNQQGHEVWKSGVAAAAVRALDGEGGGGLDGLLQGPGNAGVAGGQSGGQQMIGGAGGRRHSGAGAGAGAGAGRGRLPWPAGPPRLPGVRGLKAAGRHDLVYALQLHGRDAFMARWVERGMGGQQRAAGVGRSWP